MENEQLLSELISLSEKKEIPYTPKQLAKMSEEKLQSIYDDYKRKELDDFNEAMADVCIQKLEDVLKNQKYIKEDSTLGKKLQNKKLFRNDLKCVISYITPFLPFVGLIEGGVTIASEVVENFLNKNEDFARKTSQRYQQDQDGTNNSENDESQHD